MTNLSNHIFFSSHVNVSIPKTTRRNGSLFVHIYLHPQGSQPFQNDLASYNTAPLTKYALNKGISFNLLSEKPERNEVHTCIINPYNKAGHSTYFSHFPLPFQDSENYIHQKLGKYSAILLVKPFNKIYIYIIIYNVIWLALCARWWLVQSKDIHEMYLWSVYMVF